MIALGEVSSFERIILGNEDNILITHIVSLLRLVYEHGEIFKIPLQLELYRY